MELQPYGLPFSRPYLCSFDPLGSSNSTALFGTQVHSRIKSPADLNNSKIDINNSYWP